MLIYDYQVINIILIVEQDAGLLTKFLTQDLWEILNMYLHEEFKGGLE